MTSNKQPVRVLLTLDCGAVDADAFRALALLTGVIRGEGDLKLTGLYVEDEDLYDAARLPGMTEVSTNGSVSALEPRRVYEQIANQARLAREAFEAQARGMKLDHSFQIMRGRGGDVLVDAASNSDFVVVTRSLRASGMRTRRGPHFEPLVKQRKSLLFVNEPWASGTSVIALCESNPTECQAALGAAQRIAEAEGIRWLLATPGSQNEYDYPAADRTIALPNWTEDAIVDLCEREDARLLVLPRTAELDPHSLLLRLIDRLSCSLLRFES